MNFFKKVITIITGNDNNIVNGDFSGRNIFSSSKSIRIQNGKIFIDGKDVTPEKEINIVINGNVENINIDVCTNLTINGYAKKVQTTAADVKCGNVEGEVKTTSGDITCGNVGKDVTTVSGDITAQTIAGNCKTISGDIKVRK